MSNGLIVPPEKKQIITGRDELNFCEWPFGLLRWDKIVKGNYSDTFTDHILGREGKWIKREWTVIANEKFGPPNPFTDDVYVALMELTKELTNFESRRVPVTKSMVLEKIYGFHSSIPNRRWGELENEMRKLIGVVIETRNAFYQKDKRKYAGVIGFHILDDFGLLEEKRGRKGNQTVLPLGWFTWNEIFFQNLHNGYIKKLDTQIYFDLEYPLSKRLFRLLDKIAYKHTHYQFDLLTLCCEKLGMSRNYKDTYSYRRLLDRAHGELKEKGIIEQAQFGKEVIGPWNEERWIVDYWFSKVKPKFTPSEVAVLEAGVSSEEDVIFGRFELSRGQKEFAHWILAQDPGNLAPEIAVEMVLNTPHSLEMIEVIIADFEKRKKQGSKIANPIGWLRSALSNINYRRPKGIITSTDQKRKEETERETQRKKQEEARIEQEYKQYINEKIAEYQRESPELWQKMWQDELDTVLRTNPFLRNKVREEPEAIDGPALKCTVEARCRSIVEQALRLPSFEEWCKNK